MVQAVTVAAGGEVLSEAQYGRLVKELAGMVERGRGEAERAVATVFAQTYWEVGRRIDGAKLTERGGYGKGLLRELAVDLGMHERTLQKAVQFARMYPDGPTPGLSWTHYRELVRVDDDGVRRQLERDAVAAGWSVKRLTEAVRAVRLGQEPPSRKGREALARPKDAAHVYGCWVERVIDGDTLVVQLDLGFEVIRRQSVRLAGVDAPETGQGARRALRFVLERMGRARSVVVKTTTTGDPHGRYVGHLFYTLSDKSVGEVFAAGRYLNAELLEQELATRA